MDLRTGLSRIVALTCLMLLGVAGPGAAQPSDLLGSDHGGHYWFSYCQGQPDGTPLPADPRSLVTPTYDKAVAFNVAWHACLDRQPATCGELRSLTAAGGRLLPGNGNPEAGWEFSSGQPSSMFAITAAQYNVLWLAGGCSGAHRISTSLPPTVRHAAQPAAKSLSAAG